MTIIQKMSARNPNEQWVKEHCEGEVSQPTRQWAERCGRKPACSFRASYIVAGKKLCERHAGKVLITLLLTEQACEEAENEAMDREQESNYNRDIQQGIDRASRR